MNRADRIGLDYLTLLGISPPEFIRIAAEAGAKNVGLFLDVRPELGVTLSRSLSLVDEAELRAETAATARDLGVTIALIDGLVVEPGHSVDRYRPAFEILAELGASRVNSLSFEPSWERTTDEMGRLGELAAEYDATVVIETNRRFTIKTVGRGVELIEAIGLPNVKLLIDTLHVVRSNDVEALEQMDPNLIDYVQLSDGPFRVDDDDAYRQASIHNRGVPGEGEMPLARMLKHVPSHVVVSGETPLKRLRDAGVSDSEIARKVIAGIEATLEAVDA